MGWFNVVKPCVVGQLHYARPTTQPIEVDDEVAAPLLEVGNLTLYPAGAVLDGVRRTIADLGGEFAEIGERAADELSAEGIAVEVEAPKPQPPTRGGRRRTED